MAGASYPAQICAEVRAAVIGLGSVGARAARQLVASADIDSVFIFDNDPTRLAVGATALGARATPHAGPEADGQGVSVAVLATPVGDHVDLARTHLDRGRHVVSVSDGVEDVTALLALDGEARRRGLRIVVGAGFAPGLSCLLARHGAATFDSVSEVHVAKYGTGGPACARQHHEALGGNAMDWRGGAWVERRGGSGRELCWFPEPVGGQDCYRAALADGLLLVPAFPGIQRVTARQAATRRDRLTARLPMLRPPHPEGVLGAVRVEIRGRRGAATDVLVLGAMDRPGVAAGAVAAVAAVHLVTAPEQRLGAFGLAEVGDPLAALAELARRGVKAAVFEGSPVASRAVP